VGGDEGSADGFSDGSKVVVALDISSRELYCEESWAENSDGS